LSSVGIPIYATQGKGGGISIQDNFVLNKSMLSEQEQRQILMALYSINAVKAENTDVLLSKLSGIFQKQNFNWIEVDFSSWLKVGKCENVFETLKTAIFQGKRVSFNYSSSKGESIKRLVEPLKLAFKNRDWFLYGYCCLREDYRIFKLSRIRGIEISSESFSRQIPSQIFGDIEQNHDEFVTLTLLFEKELAYKVYDYFDSITEREDGKLLVEVSLPHNEWLHNFVISFCDKVEVVEPESIRKEIIEKIKNMQNKYIT